MPFASSEVSTSAIQQIRLLVGDVSTSAGGELLDDNSLTYMSNNTGNVWIASQLAANSLAAKFAGIASDSMEKTVGDLTIKRSDASSAADGYRELSRKFGRMAAANIAPFSGGLSAAGKTANAADTDIPGPSFERTLFDNPAVKAFTRSQ